jgi:hypothetical protein
MKGRDESAIRLVTKRLGEKVTPTQQKPYLEGD